MGKKQDKQPKLEENFAKLEETIGQLERDDISLEEAFAAYQNGMELLKQCSAQIDMVEKKVLILGEQGQREEMQADEKAGV